MLPVTLLRRAGLDRTLKGRSREPGGERPVRGCGEAGLGPGGDAGYHWARGTAGRGVPCGPVLQVSGA